MSIPYGPKFSWDFIFVNFANGFGFTKKFYLWILPWPGFLDYNNLHEICKNENVNSQLVIISQNLHLAKISDSIRYYSV